MGFVQAVTSVYTNYFNFQGRASRAEYWWFFLFAFLVGIVGNVLIAVLGDTVGGLLYLVFILGSLIPSIAVAVRRLHDTGKSGWWILIGLIPIVGFIVLLIFYLGKGEAGSNAYGANPLGG